MRAHTLPSSFEKTKTTLFHYPSQRKTRNAVFIFKGLYGEHLPSGRSWDNELVRLLKKDHHVFLVRTGRRDVVDKQEQFTGKTFKQECEDVARAFTFARANLMPQGARVYGVALSFGGTTLLGCSSVLGSMETVVCIGSGCGRSTETKKPLLSTLPDTPQLLAAMERFRSALVFIHGGLDAVVPLESQKKIFAGARRAKMRTWIEYSRLGHELEDATGSHLAVIANRHLRAFSS